MRIIIDIIEQDYKEKPYWQASVEQREPQRHGRFAWHKSFDSHEQARDWAIDKIESLLVPGVQDPDSILSTRAHAHEDTREASSGDYLRGSACPDCGSLETTRYPMDENHFTLYCDSCKREEPDVAKCRCDGTEMQGSDHCPQCGCEEYEETCNRPRPVETHSVATPIVRPMTRGEELDHREWMRTQLGKAPTAQEYLDERS
jgi:hypothetical protein